MSSMRYEEPNSQSYLPKAMGIEVEHCIYTRTPDGLRPLSNAEARGVAEIAAPEVEAIGGIVTVEDFTKLLPFAAASVEVAGPECSDPKQLADYHLRTRRQIVAALAQYSGNTGQDVEIDFCVRPVSPRHNQGLYYGVHLNLSRDDRWLKSLEGLTDAQTYSQLFGSHGLETDYGVAVKQKQTVCSEQGSKSSANLFRESSLNAPLLNRHELRAMSYPLSHGSAEMGAACCALALARGNALNNPNRAYSEGWVQLNRRYNNFQPGVEIGQDGQCSLNADMLVAANQLITLGEWSIQALDEDPLFFEFYQNYALRMITLGDLIKSVGSGAVGIEALVADFDWASNALRVASERTGSDENDRGRGRHQISIDHASPELAISHELMDDRLSSLDQTQGPPFTRAEIRAALAGFYRQSSVIQWFDLNSEFISATMSGGFGGASIKLSTEPLSSQVRDIGQNLNSIKSVVHAIKAQTGVDRDHQLSEFGGLIGRYGDPPLKTRLADDLEGVKDLELFTKELQS